MIEFKDDDSYGVVTDSQGDRGLGIAQLFGGPGKTAQLSRLNKTFQISDFHRFTIEIINAVYRYY